MPVYIQEKNYGHRHSKYAAQYRNKWEKILKDESTFDQDAKDNYGLSLNHNVATFKLIEREIKPAPETSSEPEKLQGKKNTGQAKYVTLPSLWRIKSEIDNNKTIVDAKTHSEQAIGQALAEGYKDITPKQPKEQSILNSYNNVTAEKYWITWVYTERVPCDGHQHGSSKYERPCDKYIEALEAEQMAAGGPPITVFFKEYLLPAQEVKYKTEIYNGSSEKNYAPLSKNSALVDKLDKDLDQDIKKGFELKYNTNIEKNVSASLHVKTTAVPKKHPERNNQHNKENLEQLKTIIAGAKQLEKNYIEFYKGKATDKYLSVTNNFFISDFIAQLRHEYYKDGGSQVDKPRIESFQKQYELYQNKLNEITSVRSTELDIENVKKAIREKEIKKSNLAMLPAIGNKDQKQKQLDELSGEIKNLNDKLVALESNKTSQYLAVQPESHLIAQYSKKNFEKQLQEEERIMKKLEVKTMAKDQKESLRNFLKEAATPLGLPLMFLPDALEYTANENKKYHESGAHLLKKIERLEQLEIELKKKTKCSPEFLAEIAQEKADIVNLAENFVATHGHLKKFPAEIKKHTETLKELGDLQSKNYGNDRPAESEEAPPRKRVRTDEKEERDDASDHMKVEPNPVSRQTL